MCRITGDWSTGSLDMLLFWQGVKIHTLISHNNEKDSQVRRIHWSPPYSAKRWSMQTSSSGIHRGCLLTHSAHPNTVANRDSIPFPMFTPASCVLCIARPSCFGLVLAPREMLDPTAIWGPWRPVRCHFWAFCGLPVCSVLLMGVNTVRECRCLRGYTWSETVSGKVVHVKKHLHDCQDPRFPRRTWQCNKMMLLLLTGDW